MRPHLATLTRLTHVQLYGVGGIAACVAVIAALAALPDLASLVLTVLNAPGAGTHRSSKEAPALAAALCKGVAACTALTHLDLHDAVATSDDHGLFTGQSLHLPHLALLRLWGCKHESMLREHLPHVARLPHLNHLDFSRDSIDEA
jgi:hypothetical protein